MHRMPSLPRRGRPQRRTSPLQGEFTMSGITKKTATVVAEASHIAIADRRVQADREAEAAAAADFARDHARQSAARARQGVYRSTVGFLGGVKQGHARPPVPEGSIQIGREVLPRDA